MCVREREREIERQTERQSGWERRVAVGNVIRTVKNKISACL